MSAFRFRQVICSLAVLVVTQVCNADGGCPRTIGANEVFLEPWPQAETWFGSESLAVILPQDGIWPTTVSGHLIAVKLFWYSVGFQPGMEHDFVGRIERLDDGPNDAVISRPTNAGLANGVWTILTGVDFNSAGCWRISGEYRGQSLEFVVETIDHAEWTSSRQKSE